jgi:hypothetical protein
MMYSFDGSGYVLDQWMVRTACGCAHARCVTALLILRHPSATHQ